MANSGAKTAATVLLVMIAFAANSVLGRVAMVSTSGDHVALIDPATYTIIRIVCGAVALLGIQVVRRRQVASMKAQTTQTFWRWLKDGSLSAPLMLALYAVAFSFAYVKLDAASGTLILFAFVQLTMVGMAAFKGERPRIAEVAGLVIASAGLAYLLVSESTEFTVARESLMMMAAGIGWGAYSAFGKGSNDPIGDTARNFARSVPLVLTVCLLALTVVSFRATGTGIALAAVSGAVTSGLGYVLWYIVLPQLRSAQAAAAQLSVPIIAAVGGVLWAGDAITQRQMVAGVIILGGIAMTVNWRKRNQDSQDNASQSATRVRSS